MSRTVSMPKRSRAQLLNLRLQTLAPFICLGAAKGLDLWIGSDGGCRFETAVNKAEQASIAGPDRNPVAVRSHVGRSQRGYTTHGASPGSDGPGHCHTSGVLGCIQSPHSCPTRSAVRGYRKRGHQADPHQTAAVFGHVQPVGKARREVWCCFGRGHAASVLGSHHPRLNTFAGTRGQRFGACYAGLYL